MDPSWGNPITPVTKRMREQANDHRGFIACGLAATYDDSAREAATAYPIGRDDLVLRVCKQLIGNLTRKTGVGTIFSFSPLAGIC